MKIIVRTKNIDLTDGLRGYIDEKVGRLDKYYDQIQKAEVELMVMDSRNDENSQRVEVTLFANGAIFRCEEESVSMFASIDIAAEKLERQLRRYKTKRIDRRRRPGKGRSDDAPPAAKQPEPEEEVQAHDDEHNDYPRIVKTKQFAVKPMTPDEACMQMEMLGHDFFMFRNARTEQINVLYMRKDGDYGLIEPEVE